MRSSAVGPDRAFDRSSAALPEAAHPMLATRLWGGDRLWPQAGIDFPAGPGGPADPVLGLRPESLIAVLRLFSALADNVKLRQSMID